MRADTSHAPSSRSLTRSNTVSTSAITLSNRALPIAERWRALGKQRAFIPYLTAGVPTPAGSLQALRCVVAARADFVAVGVALFDPLADGPTIQRATQAPL